MALSAWRLRRLLRLLWMVFTDIKHWVANEFVQPLQLMALMERLQNSRGPSKKTEKIIADFVCLLCKYCRLFRRHSWLVHTTSLVMRTDVIPHLEFQADTHFAHVYRHWVWSLLKLMFSRKTPLELQVLDSLLYKVVFKIHNIEHLTCQVWMPSLGVS